MSKAANIIKQGLQEAIAHARGADIEVKVHRPRPVDVKATASVSQQSQRSLKDVLMDIPEVGTEADFVFRSGHR